MFCPTCGRDNSIDIKFCASCGTNLDAVSQALTGREEDFITRLDTGMDQFIARYSEHVFSKSHAGSNEHKVARSWRLLGQGIATSFIDLLLFILMWNFLPLRALILLVSTPFRLLSERSRDHRTDSSLTEGYKPPELRAETPGRYLSEPVPSVTEHTTTNLGAETSSKKEKAPVTDQLE